MLPGEGRKTERPLPGKAQTQSSVSGGEQGHFITPMPFSSWVCLHLIPNSEDAKKAPRSLWPFLLGRCYCFPPRVIPLQSRVNKTEVDLLQG